MLTIWCVLGDWIGINTDFKLNKYFRFDILIDVLETVNIILLVIESVIMSRQSQNGNRFFFKFKTHSTSVLGLSLFQQL